MKHSLNVRVLKTALFSLFLSCYTSHPMQCFEINPASQWSVHYTNFAASLSWAAKALQDIFSLIFYLQKHLYEIFSKYLNSFNFMLVHRSIPEKANSKSGWFGWASAGTVFIFPPLKWCFIKIQSSSLKAVWITESCGMISFENSLLFTHLHKEYFQ